MTDNEAALKLVARAMKESFDAGYDNAIAAIKKIAEGSPCPHCYDTLMKTAEILMELRS